MHYYYDMEGNTLLNDGHLHGLLRKENKTTKWQDGHFHILDESLDKARKALDKHVAEERKKEVPVDIAKEVLPNMWAKKAGCEIRVESKLSHFVLISEFGDEVELSKDDVSNDFINTMNKACKKIKSINSKKVTKKNVSRKAK